MLKELDIKSEIRRQPSAKTYSKSIQNDNTAEGKKFELVSPHIQTVYDEQYSPVLNYRGRI